MDELEQKWRAWKAEHYRDCSNYDETECCPHCHAEDDLKLVETKNGNVAYLCCQQLAKHCISLGFSKSKQYTLSFDLCELPDA